MSEQLFRLKPLAWTDTETESYADTPLGKLWTDGHVWWHQRTWTDIPCDSRDHGKHLAEAWFKAKMMEGLEPVE